MRAAYERRFDAAMLIAERDFQVQHFFASTLKTEVARLDDARVNGTDGDFVNLTAIDPEEFTVGRCVAVGAPHGLEPWMTFGCHAMLLPYQWRHHGRFPGQRG